MAALVADIHAGDAEKDARNESGHDDKKEWPGARETPAARDLFPRPTPRAARKTLRACATQALADNDFALTDMPAREAQTYFPSALAGHGHRPSIDNSLMDCRGRR